ncbi:MAG TPA: nicotinate-nucleotide adenylyltransferase [Gemmataceae bacterium]|jgi:nicotinate-nucleotide adenylyltransferase|nr:nicotinate-nucleotide adenylyltransferase [Gemmataceae bacterium]
MRIGVFGGAFDPVHYGHLLLAEQAREQVRLDQVWFVPAARHPFKATTTVAPFDRRAEMLRLAVAGHDAFRVDEIEKNRPGLSYTADTLDELKRQHPGNEFFLLVGSDTLPDLPKWHEPQRIVRAATLVIRERPGFPITPLADLQAAIGEPVRIEIITVPLNDLSSHDIRKRVAQDRSIRYMTPRAVEVYIREKGLYR